MTHPKDEAQKANPDMVEGYMDGFSDTELELPDRLANRSRSYKHGWLNGRDDRTNNPRKFAMTLENEAIQAMKEDANDYAN